jgi:hypothetical protein
VAPDGGSQNPHTTPPWIAAPGTTWPDVLRWVSDEPKEETVDRYGEVDETLPDRHGRATQERERASEQVRQVMEVANPAERAAAGVDESLARWRGHSDEELRS